MLPVVPSGIVLFLTDLTGGGAERVMLRLANQFAYSGEDVTLVLIQKSGPLLGLISSEVRLLYLDKLEGPISSRSILLGLNSVFRFRRILKEKRPGLVLAALDGPNVIATLATKLTRKRPLLVLSQHDEFTAAHSTGVMRRILGCTLIQAFKHADSVVTVSRGVANELAALGIPLEKIQTIYNPASPSNLTRYSDQMQDTWSSTNSSHRPTILAMGRFVPQKGFHDLIRAFSIVKREIDSQLIILGDGPQRRNLEELVSTLNLEKHVCLPGYVESPQTWLEGGDLFVSSSHREAFGLAIVEAMSAGLPIVSTDCLGPNEILEFGAWGKIVRAGDPEALAEAIVEVLKSPSKPCVMERAKVFNIDKAVNEYLSLFKRLQDTAH